MEWGVEGIISSKYWEALASLGPRRENTENKATIALAWHWERGASSMPKAGKVTPSPTPGGWNAGSPHQPLLAGLGRYTQSH